MNVNRSATFDLIVVGGGPAGSSAAITAAELECRVLLLERETFPRFHIGESLLPASNGLLEELGVADRVRAAGFTVKRGASFSTADGEHEHYIDFSQSREVEAPRTYQVARDRFDTILLERARECGADVREGTAAKRAEVSEAGVSLVCEDRSGARREIEAAAIVDASGQAGFLARRFRLRQRDPELASAAVHRRYRGVPPLGGDRAGDIRVISLPGMAWVWVIPLSGGVTSVGVVVPRSALARAESQPGGVLEGTLRSTPALAELFRRSEPIGPERREADFSYTPTSYAADRWLLAGDAGSFLDPVFSTGVTLALKSGREAARAVSSALEDGAWPRHLRRFSDEQRRTYLFFRRFVRAFYDPAFRDLMYQPSNRFGLVEAMTTALAGNWQPSLVTRGRLDVLFGLTALHRRYGITSRIHERGPETG